MKTILILLTEQFADWEAAFLAPALNGELGKETYQVKTVARGQMLIKSIGGFRVMPDYDFDSAPADFVGLVVVGGMTWRDGNKQAEAEFIRSAHRQGAVIGAICDGATFLASIGLLNDVKHTGNDLKDIANYAGNAYTNATGYLNRKEAHGDGKIVTANGNAPIEFAKAFMVALGDLDPSAIDEWFDFCKYGQYIACDKRYPGTFDY